MFVSYGDSHADFSFRNTNVRINSIPSLSIHQLTSSNVDLPIDNCNLIISVGEVDVRCLFKKQVDKYLRQEDEIISELVSRYFNFLKRQKKNNNLYVMSVLPPSNNEEHGHVSDRIRHTKKINEKIKEKCIEYNYNYLNVYDLYVTENGTLNPDLSGQNDVHIHDNQKVKDLLSSLN